MKANSHQKYMQDSDKRTVAKLREETLKTLGMTSAEFEKVSDLGLMKLVQEMDLYRVELEMQNEELKKAKEDAENASAEYVELYDFSPVAYITLTASKLIRRINFTAAGILGKDRSYLKDKRFDQFISDYSKQEFDDFFNSLFEFRIKKSCEVTLITDGTQVEVELSGIVTKMEGHCLISIVDITAHKLAEDRLMKSKEEAEAANELKSGFLSMMSHELRTPLNSIIGFSSILLHEKAGPLTEEQKKQLGMVLSSGRHLLSLINGLLDLSKIESGQLTPVYEDFDIQETIENAISSVEPLAQDKAVSLKFARSPQIGQIRSDKQRVHQVLLNILNNAVKFSPQGTVSVKCRQYNNHMKIDVKDTGIGIKEEDQEKIFDPFVQINNKLTRSQQGSGLGLPVSKKLIEMLNGNIKLKSKLGEGSTFTISLPIKN